MSDRGQRARGKGPGGKNNLKTTGDEEMEGKEEDEGDTSPDENNNDSSKEETLGVLEKVKA